MEGLYGRRERNPWSISPRNEVRTPGLSRRPTARLYQRLDLGVDLDLLAYTPAELAEMPEAGLARRALIEGEVIYERDVPR